MYNTCFMTTYINVIIRMSLLNVLYSYLQYVEANERTWLVMSLDEHMSLYSRYCTDLYSKSTKFIDLWWLCDMHSILFLEIILSVKVQSERKLRHERHIREALEQELSKFRQYCAAQEKEIELLQAVLRKHDICYHPAEKPVAVETISVVAEVNSVAEYQQSFQPQQLLLEFQRESSRWLRHSCWLCAYILKSQDLTVDVVIVIGLFRSGLNVNYRCVFWFLSYCVSAAWT